MAGERPPYREGDWFLVPVGDGRWVLGRVARHDGAHTVLGYFFAPARDDPPRLGDVGDLGPEQSYTQLIFSDLALRDGRWPVLGQEGRFPRDAWPMVEFERYLGDEGHEPRLYSVTYSDDDPNTTVARRRIPLQERGQRPPDALWGAEAAEAAVRERLPRPPDEGRPEPARAAARAETDAPGTVHHYLHLSDEGAAEAVAREARNRGHAVEVRPPGPEAGEWVVRVSDPGPLSWETLDQRERELTSLAIRYGGEYEGIEIAV